MSSIKTLPKMDVKVFNRRRYENYLKEKDILQIRRVNEDLFEVSNPEKNVMYQVQREQTPEGIMYASCTCQDWQSRATLYNLADLPKCKHIYSCIQSRRENPQLKQQQEEREEQHMNRKFDPQKYLIKIKGKDYLEVKFRIHWFRLERPDWGIRTTIEKLDLERGVSVIRADVYDEQGVHKSSGVKMEYKKNFFDFTEKAETGSIGRALAALGYGTLQSLDMDEGIEKNRIADSPVQLSSQRNRGNGKAGNGKSGNGKNVGKIGDMSPEVRQAIERW